MTVSAVNVLTCPACLDECMQKLSMKTLVALTYVQYHFLNSLHKPDIREDDTFHIKERTERTLRIYISVNDAYTISMS